MFAYQRSANVDCRPFEYFNVSCAPPPPRHSHQTHCRAVKRAFCENDETIFHFTGPISDLRWCGCVAVVPGHCYVYTIMENGQSCTWTNIRQSRWKNGSYCFFIFAKKHVSFAVSVSELPTINVIKIPYKSPIRTNNRIVAWVIVVRIIYTCGLPRFITMCSKCELYHLMF